MTAEEMSEFMDPDSIQYRNMWYIMQHGDCQDKIQELKEVEHFISDFDLLSFDRDFIMCRNHIISIQTVFTSFELTAGSIVSCCQFGCFADAKSLLRKFRDDMFFYLYLVVYDQNKQSILSKSNITEMENNIERWIRNDLSDLQIGDVLKAIAQSPATKEAVQKYNLKAYFDRLGARLNNYVHSNGIKYYNRNVVTYKDDELQEHLNSILEDMRFITVTFVFLLTLCAPYYISSTDYVYYLDCGMEPQEDSQYWVAPFVTNFLKENLNLIDKSCIDYLRDNTSMVFD